ncbi:hypothetical protein ACFYNO_30375 [Kitasatospora sp. NPDC006697]|uniref:hypothetical protein n=1 Tax=Kitasatospora sp. NPDC006697 TaxID=3364020 RepID=UPI0036CD5189
MSEQRERSGGGRRIDLSMAQVAASALATVAGAVLASGLGVYGTIAGAAVVSIGATCGGAVFQHLFRRTGEQLREVTDRSPNRTANGLRQVPVVDGAPPAAWRNDHEPEPGNSWNESPVRRARRRWTWKGYAAISALVFVLAMAPIVVVELATGQNMHAITSGQDGGGTSILPGLTTGGSGATTPQRGPAPAERPAPPAGSASAGPSSPPSGGPSSTPTPSTSPSSSPSPSASGSTGTPSAPATTGTPSAPATPSDTPSARPSTGGTADAGSAPPAPAAETASPATASP